MPGQLPGRAAFRLAGRQGFEPRSHGSEPCVLPLDDLPAGGKISLADPSRVRQRAGPGGRRLRAMKLEISSEQRFTCQQCGMCCRGAWVVVTPAEVERYRKVGVARLYTDGGTIAEAMDIDPFEPVAHGHYRIRQRADGACGFLSADNRCRIHEELGGEAKPLACRVFPFRFHPVEGRPLVTTSASCPTIVKNEGAPLAAQAQGDRRAAVGVDARVSRDRRAAALRPRAAHRGRDPGRDQGHAASGCWSRPPAPRRIWPAAWSAWRGGSRTCRAIAWRASRPPPLPSTSRSPDGMPRRTPPPRPPRPHRRSRAFSRAGSCSPSSRCASSPPRRPPASAAT